MEMTIQTTINNALAAHWNEHTSSPAALRVNPNDITEFLRSIFKTEPGTEPQIADGRRTESDKAVEAGISYWIDGYAGGVPVPVKTDPEIAPGTVELETSA